ncbi:hypothetical protein [Clostridium massiliamazoniense]|uniref:hypothetical protein n=1 Tax=Clostridium massiliamazoniense TaxID=1347366 RepID=UPI0006D81271|nr:hypothetical protein [Clostridium massiliamazoniense]
MRGKFHLRYVKQKLFLLLLVNVILVIAFGVVGLKYDGFRMLFFLSLLCIFEFIAMLLEIDFSNFNFFTVETLKSGAFMGTLIMLFSIILRDLMNTFPMLYGVMIALFITTILERGKKKVNNRWWERGYENDFDEDEINIFWRFNTKFEPKYKGNIEKIRFYEALDSKVTTRAIFLLLILPELKINGQELSFKFIMAIMIIYVFIATKGLYCIDKHLNIHVELNGICTGMIEKNIRRHGPPKYIYKVSIVNFENKIERVINVKEDDIFRFSEEGEVTLVYGAISKKVVMVY